MTDLAPLRTSLAGLGALTGTAASTVTAGQATITVGGISVTANVVQGLTLAVGDIALVTRQGSMWWVINKLFTAAPTDPGAPIPPSPKPTTRTGALVCNPVETRSYRGGSWRTDTDDVLQGVYAGYPNNTGCAFYGSKPRSLSGATVTSATIKVKRIKGGAFSAQTSTLRLMTERTKPSGGPTLTSSTSGPSLKVNASTTFTIPTSWAQNMVDGTAGGLAVYDSNGSPYIRYAGRGSYAGSFTLTIRWSR